MTLAVFDIGKAVENGVVIEPVHEQSTGTIRFAPSLPRIPVPPESDVLLRQPSTSVQMLY
jgi:hypothetical protein